MDLNCQCSYQSLFGRWGEGGWVRVLAFLGASRIRFPAGALRPDIGIVAGGSSWFPRDLGSVVTTSQCALVVILNAFLTDVFLIGSSKLYGSSGGGGDFGLSSDSFKRHLMRAGGRLLARVYTLYFLHAEIVGLELAEGLCDGSLDHTAFNQLAGSLPPLKGKLSMCTCLCFRSLRIPKTGNLRSESCRHPGTPTRTPGGQ